MTAVRGSIELQRRFKAIADTAGMMKAIGDDAVLEAKRDYRRKHTKTGVTQRSIRLARFSKARALIEAGGAAGFIERGTKPHLIRARRQRALRFAIGGSSVQRLTGTPRRGADVVFARSVQHPGTSPSPILVPAVERVLERKGIPRKYIVTRWDGAA